VAAKGHRSVQAAISGADASAAGIATRKVYERTTTLAGDQAVALAQIIIEAQQQPVVEEAHNQAVEPVQQAIELPGPKQPRHRKPGKKALEAKAFLEKHIIKPGQPVRATRLQEMARAEGVLALHESINESQRLRRAAKQLGIRSRRIGFGPDAHYVWTKPRPSREPRRSDQPADTI